MEDRIYRPGELVAHLQILEHLATGGFSAVYKVHDHKDNDQAAPAVLKISRFDLRTLPKGTRHDHNARLLREYNLLRKLEHQCIVKVEESGVHAGAAFYVMELLDGPTLSTYLAEKRRSYAELGFIFQRISSALAHAHARGVIHRDLKPGNIIVERRFTEVDDREPDDFSDVPDGTDLAEASEIASEAAAASWPAHLQRTGRQPVLIDFGISQAVGVSPITAPGAMLGTAEYLSPDYAGALLRAVESTPSVAYHAEPHEDVYQAGVILYSMLTGQLPTKAPSGHLLELLREIQRDTPPHPRELNSSAPRALSELAMRCLAKRAKDRPADGAELLWRVNSALNEDREQMNGLAPQYRVGEGTPISAITEKEQPQIRSGRAPAIRDANGSASPEFVPVWMSASRFIARHGFALVLLGLLLLRAYEDSQTRAALFELTRTLSLTNAQHSFSDQLAGAMPPSVGGAALLQGLKMPEKPDPRWLKPGADGRCRDPESGQRLVATVYRGVCWSGMKKIKPDYDCGDTYDPPPEAESRHSDWCFTPYMAPIRPRSISPDVK